MLRFSILVALLAPVVLGEADHATFLNCSRVPFCTRLRENVPDASSLFAADIGGFTEENNNIVHVPLSNSDGESLVLQISLLEGYKARVKVVEPDSSRYELEYVLDGEPETLPSVNKLSKDKENKDKSFLKCLSTINQANQSLTLFPADEQYYSVVVTSGPPFTVEFYLGETLEVVLNAERLVMENTNESIAFTFTVDYPGATALYGLYHHAHNIVLRQTGNGFDPFRLRNSDVSFYELDSPMALYGSIPVVYAHSPDRTSGIYVHNAAEQWIDINYTSTQASTYFIIQGGTLDLFVLFGPTPQQVVRQYTSLTGVAHLPQIWTLGYHQCRFTYQTQEEVKEVVALMDQYDFPMDVIVLDDGHSNANRYFEFNPVNFTNPEEMLRNISVNGRKAVPISDPHIKIADDYAVYTGAKNKYFVKWANGSDYEGVCWPGLSSYIDFFNPEASDYYGSWYAYDKFNGSTPVLAGIWNDMNEPSVFDDTTEKTFPFELVHYGNILHRDVHNIYGFMHVRATHKGLILRDEGRKRPFILTRSSFAGSQRYAAIWTGDNTAGWGYLQVSYSECLVANILGHVFCGADIGGFFDNDGVLTDELIQRWYQAAAWLPFMRGHSNKGTPRREPYVFAEDVRNVLREALKKTPLFYEYPELLEYDDHLLLGSDILARPVFESNVTTSPLFYRGGSIITRNDIERPSTTQMVNDPFTLYVNLDSNEEASGRFYIDDYTSFDYNDFNDYLYLRFIYVPESHGVRIERLNGDGLDFNISIRRIVISGETPEGKPYNCFGNKFANISSLKTRTAIIAITCEIDLDRKVFFSD
ncbi:hypothetical protein NQ317_009479 [Molorchus minor]|uniref:Glucosidase II subunit alpha n=1 Tax=Molorchus minor TaxID=1323400 RepID=A0ABQ9JKV8_9CUCU|nr:hypothetical protein NQ317_009479 [Molorchus minor]